MRDGVKIQRLGAGGGTPGGPALTCSWLQLGTRTTLPPTSVDWKEGGRNGFARRACVRM